MISIGLLFIGIFIILLAAFGVSIGPVELFPLGVAFCFASFFPFTGHQHPHG